MTLSTHSLQADKTEERRAARASRLISFAQRYVSSTVALGIGLLAHTLGLILVARALGPAQFGTLTLITTISTLGLAVSGLGGSEVLRRTVARDPAIYPRALGHALVTLLPISLGLSVLLSLGLALWLPVTSSYGSSFVVTFLLVGSNIVLFAWLGLAEQILLSFDATGAANIVNVVSGLARALAAIIACLVFHVTSVVEWAVWHFGFYVAASAAAFIPIWKYGRPTLGLLPGELGKGATLSVTNLLMILRQNADVLALSLVATPAMIGVYSVARRVIGTASVLSASFDRVVYSSLARAGASGLSAVTKLASRYALYSGALCFASVVATFALAPLLPLVFGHSYADAVPLLQAMSGLLLLTGLHYLAFDALNAADQHRPRLIAEVGASVIGLALLAGAAASGSITSIILATYAAAAIVVVALWGTLFHLKSKSAIQPAREVS